MSAISVAGLLEGEGGSYVVKTEDGSVVQYIPQQAGETVEAGTDDNGQVFGNEIQLQQLSSGAESGGQDLVSLAMESTKECEVPEHVASKLREHIDAPLKVEDPSASAFYAASLNYREEFVKYLRARPAGTQPVSMATVACG